MSGNWGRMRQLTGFLLALAVFSGCAPARDVFRADIRPDDGPVIELALEPASGLGPGIGSGTGPGIVAGSSSEDGFLWLLDAASSQVLVLHPATAAAGRVPLVDASGRTLLDPVSVDASGGLSLLVADRSTSQVLRYDRKGALMSVHSIPDPGPFMDHASVSKGREGVRFRFHRMAATAGNGFAVLEEASTRLGIVDPDATEVRFVDFSQSVAALAAGGDLLLLVDESASSIHLVADHAVLEGIIHLPAAESPIRMADLAFQDGDLFIMGTEGELWMISNLMRPGPDRALQLRRFRSAGPVRGEWRGLVALHDDLWWIGNEGVFRSARPR